MSTDNTQNLAGAARASGTLKGSVGASGSIKGSVSVGDTLKGDPGVTFIPTIDPLGNLSWSNNGGMENPRTVNVTGFDCNVYVDNDVLVMTGGTKV